MRDSEAVSREDIFYADVIQENRTEMAEIERETINASKHLESERAQTRALDDARGQVSRRKKSSGRSAKNPKPLYLTWQSGSSAHSGENMAMVVWILIEVALILLFIWFVVD